MDIKTKKEFSKTITFEKTGEVISIKVIIENPSPETSDEIILSFAKTLLQEMQKKLI